MRWWRGYDPVRLDVARQVGDDQQYEQQDRQHDSDGQRIHEPFGFAVVVDERERAESEADDNGQKDNDDQSFEHGRIRLDRPREERNCKTLDAAVVGNAAHDRVPLV